MIVRVTKIDLIVNLERVFRFDITVAVELSGAVDEDVEATERFDCGVDQAFRVQWFVQISDHFQCLTIRDN